jgi:hypothetical protein
MQVINFTSLLLICISSTVSGFSIASFPITRATRTCNISSQRTTCLYSSSKEEQIAELEAQLRKLKEEESSATELESKDDDDTAIRTEAPAALEVPDEPFEEMLSEAWKDKELTADDNDGGVMGLVKNGAAVIVTLAVLAAFSQIPVGDENYNKYSTAKPSTSIDLGDLNPSKPSY